MVARGKNLPRLGEIEVKMEEIRQLLENKEPRLSSEEIDELVLFMINQNFLET